MAVIRRNPGLFGGLGAVVILAAFGWFLWAHPAATLGEEGYEPIDALTAARIDVLRHDAGLDNDVLGAMDLSAAELEALLSDLRDWYGTNSASLVAQWSTLADQRARIRYLQSAINMGGDEAEALATAQQALARSQAAYETLLASARSATLSELEQSEQALAEHMRSQAALPMPYRVLDLSTSQQADLKRAQAHYQQRLCVARTAEQRSTYKSMHDQDVSAAIGVASEQTLASLRGYLGSSSERVVTALDTVLPVADEG